MCEPMTAALIMGGASAATSIYGGIKGNKAANKLAQAQAAAAEQQFYQDRARTELNYQMDLEALEQQEQAADYAQAKEEDNILIAIGDKIPIGNSTAKIMQNSIASGALNMAALQGSRENLRRQNVYNFKDNESNYKGRLEEIKSNLNQNFQSASELTIGAVNAGLQGAVQGAQMGSNIKKATEKVTPTKQQNANKIKDFIKNS